MPIATNFTRLLHPLIIKGMVSRHHFFFYGCICLAFISRFLPERCDVLVCDEENGI